MVPDVSTGDRSRGLLSYLFGPGRRNEHTDPHIVAAFAMPGINDPGRVPVDRHHEALSELADYLDQPVRLREQRLGKKVPQHVWHCPVRTAPGDRYLTDDEWAEVARRIVHATGIAEHDDDAACRWIAVRHADDHIHIMATSVREDGRRPRNKGDGRRAQAECRRIEAELGLRRLKSGDATAPKTPTGPEVAKAERQGRKNTARVWLREHAYVAAAAARDEGEFFAVLTSLGIKVRPRLGPVTGEVTGYSLATADDTDARGESVFYSGSALAPDLSLNRLRERFGPAEGGGTGRATALRAGRAEPGSSWRHADRELRTTYTLVTRANGGTAGSEADAQVQAQAAAFAELLHNTAVSAPRRLRAELQAAAIAFNRANRSAIRAEHRAADALRRAGRALLSAPTGKDGDFVVAALTSAVFLLIALTEWHAQRGHEQQAAAAQQSLIHLRAAQQQAARPALAQLAAHAPSPRTRDRLAAVVRATIPEHARRILADPAWPALATALAQAESAGTSPHRALADLSGQRELDTADRPPEVLVWRLRNATAERVSQRARSATTRSARSTRPTTHAGVAAAPVVQPPPAGVNRRHPSR
ncbi:relaxase/mobilization nuclease domain-containing protein [Streptomyces sp. NPDC059477]|uniref:relaxase/mobilization nuclease domain-containing protein n=1 Tax=Streptomyces sp. NPDC059477 TaxID=3346847 RepID=UPI003680CE70